MSRFCAPVELLSCGKITEIAVLTDPVRLRQFGRVVLNG